MRETDETRQEKSIDQLLVDTAERLRAKFTKAPFLVCTDWIKRELRYFPERPEGDESLGIKFVPVGVVLEDNNGKKSFIYTSLYTLDQKARRIALCEMNPIQIYCYVSFEAFSEAERIYQRSKNLDAVEKYLMD